MAATTLNTGLIIRTPMVKPTPSRSKVAMVVLDQKPESSMKERTLSRGAEGSFGTSSGHNDGEVSTDGRANVGPRENREPKRAVKVGRRPPGGEALTARSVVRHIMGCEARQGFVVAPLCAVWGTRCDPSPEPGDAGRADPRPGCRSSLRREERHGVVRPQPGGLNQYLGLAAVRGP